MFGTNFSTDGDSFDNYYKDVSRKMKLRELDLLIVVNMFLTGFDSKTVNTLWVDKNLKMDGLVQAYSRTNRILNSLKPSGNIVLPRPRTGNQGRLSPSSATPKTAAASPPSTSPSPDPTKEALRRIRQGRI